MSLAIAGRAHRAGYYALYATHTQKCARMAPTWQWDPCLDCLFHSVHRGAGHRQEKVLQSRLSAHNRLPLPGGSSVQPKNQR
jgi:hypothetical protein